MAIWPESMLLNVAWVIIACYIFDIAPVQLKVRIVGDPLSRKAILHGFHDKIWQMCRRARHKSASTTRSARFGMSQAWWKCGMTISIITLTETNIAPENRASQKETSIPTIHFQVRAVSFREDNFFVTNPMPRPRCHKGKKVCLHKICQRGPLTSQGQPVQVRVSSAQLGTGVFFWMQRIGIEVAELPVGQWNCWDWNLVCWSWSLKNYSNLQPFDAQLSSADSLTRHLPGRLRKNQGPFKSKEQIEVVLTSVDRQRWKIF